MIPSITLLVDGDPLTYKFGIAEDPDEAYRHYRRYLRELIHATGASTVKVYLTPQDCLKMYRYHVGTIKPYQGNRSGKTYNLPSRKFLFRMLLEDGAIVNKFREADDLIVDASNADPEFSWIISPDKDLHQARGRVWQSEYKQPFHGYHALYQILQGDRADNIPALIQGWGPKKSEKFLSPFNSLQEARKAVFELARDNTSRLWEISALVLLGGPVDPAERVREFWSGFPVPDDLFRGLCDE